MRGPHLSVCKYLGLSVSQDLRWDKHVDRVVAKDNNSLNFLCRNSKFKYRQPTCQNPGL